jgi:hypothetical protein
MPTNPGDPIYFEMSGPEFMTSRVNDVGKVATTLSFFASAIKSGEAWTDVCERALREANDALQRLAK